MSTTTRQKLPGMRRRRGAMAVMVAVLLTVFMVCVAFAVDVAYMQLVRTDLRTATDASARASGEALSRTQDLAIARQTAKDIAAKNRVAGTPLLLDDSDVVFGNSTRELNGSWSFTPNGTPVNSIRINARRTQDSLSGSVPLFFGRLLGRNDFEPKQKSTVVRLDRDICLVVDRSSSMKLFLTDTAPTMSTSDPRFCQPPDPSQSRWAALEDAVLVFNTALGTTPQIEYVGLVSYASSGTWCSYWNAQVSTNQVLTSNTSLVNSAMTSLSATVFNGATNISAGINRGVTVLTDPANGRPFAAKTMVLFTDGHATQGGDPVIAAANAANANIVIHTVTFGDGANQADMQAVAAATGGKSFHAPTAQALNDIFEEIALTMPVVFTE